MRARRYVVLPSHWGNTARNQEHHNSHPDKDLSLNAQFHCDDDDQNVDQGRRGFGMPCHNIRKTLWWMILHGFVFPNDGYECKKKLIEDGRRDRLETVRQRG